METKVKLFSDPNHEYGYVKVGVFGPIEEIRSIYDLIHIEIPSSAIQRITRWANEQHPKPDSSEGTDAYYKALNDRIKCFDDYLSTTITNLSTEMDYRIFNILPEVVDLDALPLRVLYIFLSEAQEHIDDMCEDAEEWDVEQLRDDFQPAIDALKEAIERKIRGYVYLIKSASGYWKIGCTANPDDRIKTFSVKLPFEVEYEHLIPCEDHYSAENELHARFSAKRVNGEWFCLDASEVAWIKAIKSM